MILYRNTTRRSSRTRSSPLEPRSLRGSTYKHRSRKSRKSSNRHTRTSLVNATLLENLHAKTKRRAWAAWAVTAWSLVKDKMEIKSRPRVLVMARRGKLEVTYKAKELIRKGRDYQRRTKISRGGSIQCRET